MEQSAAAAPGERSVSLARLKSLLAGGRWIIILLFGLVGVVFVLTPIWAVSWASRPFPGFVVEQTLVVADYDGEGWTGRSYGLGYPQRVIRLGDQSVFTLWEFEEALSAYEYGDRISLGVIDPQGIKFSYSGIELTSFPLVDLMRLFWLPYLVGLAFLGVGIWVYHIRGDLLPSRAFAVFCICAAAVNGLLFDLITTHHASFLWSLAITMLGSSLISLALLFPEESRLVHRYRWVRFFPYGVSAALFLGVLLVLYDGSQPWAYVTAWRFSYFYAAFGIFAFLTVLLLRLRRETSDTVRQQIRIILWGGLVAFVPVGIWLAGPLFRLLMSWNTVLFLPFLIMFPLSIGIAILRYRLWEVDLLINQTLVYGALTLLLGGFYYGSIVILQNLFTRLIGEESPVAIAASTLGIALLFSPLRAKIQETIDRRFFRHRYDSAKTLAAFNESIRHEVDLERLTEKLIIAVKETLHPSRIILCSCHQDYPGQLIEIPEDDPLRDLFLRSQEPVEIERIHLDSPGVEILKASGTRLAAPLISQGEVVGLLSLGPALGENKYTYEDRRLLGMLASQAAPALQVAQLVRQQRVKVQEKQRMEHELRVARFIQQTLLPKMMPALQGWSINGHYQPAQAVGGDFFDFINYPDGRLGLVIGDATGKGIPAALMMAAARSIVRSVAFQIKDSPGDILRKANDLLISATPSSMFVTCLVAILDPESGRMTFANAGHSLPCQLKDGEVRQLWATGMPLGLMSGMEYEEGDIYIEPGEAVFFYSDGLVEAHNRNKDMFGTPRLKKFLETIPNRAALIDHLLVEWGTFKGDDIEQEDDMTLVSLLHTRSRRPGD